jgi:ribosomal protein L32
MQDLNVLKRYIKQTQSIDIAVHELNNFITLFKDQIKYPLEISNNKAVVFTNENQVKIIKFGSETCPRCNEYKNFEKTCPYCSYTEYYNG